MKKEVLATEGGKPVIRKPFPIYRSIGKEEIKAANKVLESGILSGFIAVDGEGFLGGPEVKLLEEEACKMFNVKNVVSVNSWTSGLIAAVGAIGVKPGDEIILPPWTMVATATAILHWNAIPVFCDIDPLTFNIDPNKVENLITKKTKAILCVDIFGQSCDMNALRDIANKFNLKLISDTAQAPGAMINNNFAGTNADIGGFSLNYHKHINCGEGGLLVTNNDLLAHRLRLIRNHGEAVIKTNNKSELSNILGYNFRLGEIEAAITREQLKKLPYLIEEKQLVAKKLYEGLSNLKGLNLPTILDNSTHVFYIFGMTIDLEILDKDRDWIIKNLKAEGVPAILDGYQNIHLNPLFKNKIAYGESGFPWEGLKEGPSTRSYNCGLCPTAEKLHNKTFIGLNLCAHFFTEAETELVIKSFKKVWSNLVIK